MGVVGDNVENETDDDDGNREWGDGGSLGSIVSQNGLTLPLPKKISCFQLSTIWKSGFC